MNRCDHKFRSSILDWHTSSLHQSELATQQGLRGSSAKANDHLRFHKFHFSFKPRLACTNFRHRGLLVKPPFASFLESEVLDHVGNICVGPVNRGIRQRPVKKAAGRTYKGMSLEVLFIARLFPDQDNPRRLGPFSENGLRRIQVEIATPAGLRGNSELGQRSAIRKESLCTGKCSRRGHNQGIRCRRSAFRTRNRMDSTESIL